MLQYLKIVVSLFVSLLLIIGLKLLFGGKSNEEQKTPKTERVVFERPIITQSRRKRQKRKEFPLEYESYRYPHSISSDDSFANLSYQATMDKLNKAWSPFTPEYSDTIPPESLRSATASDVGTVIEHEQVDDTFQYFPEVFLDKIEGTPIVKAQSKKGEEFE